MVSTRLSPADHRGALRIRLNIRRGSYTVPPGLYAVGAPRLESFVFLSANYKLSFDHLRRALHTLDAWILVLDTHGINVWCAAGKGTFGTQELLERLSATHLAEVVTHRTLIAPQLGAPGIAAHEVAKESGFRVNYGPIRAHDIPAYLAAGCSATPEMRRVHFGLADRLVLIPVELALYLGYALLGGILLFFLSGIGAGGYSFQRALTAGPAAAGLMLLAGVAGTTLPAALLPWLPGRSFSVKGGIVGLSVVALALGLRWIPTHHILELLAWILIIPSCTSFLAMNFTGSSTFTSLSGVKKEMRMFLIPQLVGTVLGLILWTAARLA